MVALNSLNKVRIMSLVKNQTKLGVLEDLNVIFKVIHILKKVHQNFNIVKVIFESLGMVI